MRPRRTLALVVLALIGGCGGGTAKAPHHAGTASIPKECARLTAEADARLPAPQAGEFVGQENAGCSSITVPARSLRPANVRMLVTAFSTVAGHRIGGAVGYSCTPPASMQPGVLVACSVEVQGRRGESRYAVRLRPNGCWRAISLSGGADLAGCSPRWNTPS